METSYMYKGMYVKNNDKLVIVVDDLLIALSTMLSISDDEARYMIKWYLLFLRVWLSDNPSAVMETKYSHMVDCNIRRIVYLPIRLHRKNLFKHLDYSERTTIGIYDLMYDHLDIRSVCKYINKHDDEIITISSCKDMFAGFMIQTDGKLNELKDTFGLSNNSVYIC